MFNIVGIRFPNSGKTYNFKAENIDVKRCSRVVVESELGISIGEVVRVTECDDTPDSALKPVLRKVTAADLKQEEENNVVKVEARHFGNERIAARALPMKLIDTDVTLDRKRFIFYFVADTRIDFRELVKDLASKFKTRIELRQIGVRDAAKMVGGFGICGREFCCKTFLKGFAPISIKMAKQQNLVLNTGKLSGQCGRLMCCLNYEYYKGDPINKKRKIQKVEPEPEAKDTKEIVAKADAKLDSAIESAVGAIRPEAKPESAQQTQGDRNRRPKPERANRGSRDTASDRKPQPQSDKPEDAPKQDKSSQTQQSKDVQQDKADAQRRSRRNRRRRKKKPVATATTGQPNQQGQGQNQEKTAQGGEGQSNQESNQQSRPQENQERSQQAQPNQSQSSTDGASGTTTEQGDDTNKSKRRRWRRPRRKKKPE